MLGIANYHIRKPSLWCQGSFRDGQGRVVRCREKYARMLHCLMWVCAQPGWSPEKFYVQLPEPTTCLFGATIDPIGVLDRQTKCKSHARYADMQPDMWKWGQVRPGDRVKFVLTSVDFAMAKRRLERDRIAAVYEAATSGQQLVADSFPVRPTALHWRLCVWWMHLRTPSDLRNPDHALGCDPSDGDLCASLKFPIRDVVEIKLLEYPCGAEFLFRVSTVVSGSAIKPWCFSL